MSKVRRTERLVALTKLLVDMPGRLFSLSYFSQVFGAAKSTLSEDMVTIKQAMQEFNLGTLQTISGAAGGVRFVPQRSGEVANVLLADISHKLAEPERIIPGGFLYMTDILFMPHLMVPVGEIFMTKFSHLSPNYIMTVETKGIPLALMTARAFDVPLVIVRQGSKVTEGPSVSINYLTGSGKRIQTMSLPKRAIPPGSRVLVIDDFMKAGGTAQGMVELAHEVDSEVIGTGVLVATAEPVEKLVQDYLALLILHDVDQHTKKTDIRVAL
ncbi:MAG TPA: pur operon repressor [Negativicutes bacterium]